MFAPKREEKTLHDLYTSKGVLWNDAVRRKALKDNFITHGRRGKLLKVAVGKPEARLFG